MSLVTGQILGGHYQIISALSQGGFGATFLAEDQYLPNKPRCVVKQLKPQATDPLTLETARRLFDTEAQVLHLLGNHNQIPRLLAYFEENQEFYLVQELIEGHDLSQELQPGVQWSEAQAIALLQDVLQILEFVHQQQVIHRDVNPRNLVRRQQDQKLVLIDFGAVKQISTTFLQVGQAPRTVAIGTPGYLPIEQATGNPQPTSDLYALGMVAIQAMTGLAPQDLPKDSQTGELLWHQAATVSPELRSILDKMVRYDFRDRYQSATQVLAALKDVSTAPSATVAIAPPTRRSALAIKLPKLSSWRRSAFLGVAVVTVGAIAAVFGVRYFTFSSATDLYRKGETLAALQRYPEALAAYDKALQIRQDYPEAWNGRGQVLTQLKQYSKALDAYDRAIQIDPQSWESWSDRGLLLNTWQRHNEALQSFNQAIALNPDAPEAWNGKGQALIGAKRYEEAIAAFKQALTLQPDSAPAWYGQGWALHNLQKYDEAVKAYDKALEIKSDYHQAWYNRGNSLSSLQKYQEAIASYDKAVKFQPRFYQAWYSRGNMQSNLQQYEAALESYEQVTKLQPSYYPAFYSRAWTLHRLQRYDEAIAAYDKALDLNPNDYLAWYNRGNALYNLKRYDKAIAAYDQALQIKPDHYESWYSLGNALTNVKRYPDALAAYDKALQYKSDYREAREAREQLKQRLESSQRQQESLEREQNSKEQERKRDRISKEQERERDRTSEEQEQEAPQEEQNSENQEAEGDRT